MEKRAILAIALSVLVFIAFQYFNQKRSKQQIANKPSTATQVQPQTKERPKELETETRPASMESAPVEAEISTADTNASARTVDVETDSYHAVIDNRGAVLTKWQLKSYKSGQDSLYEMISGEHSGANPTLPGSLIFQDPELTRLANDQLYEVKIEGQNRTPKALTPPITVIMEFRRGGLNIIKRYTFEKDTYIIDLSIECSRGNKGLEGRFLIGQNIGPEQEHKNNRVKLQAVYFSGGKIKRESPPDDEKEIKKIQGDVRWVGLDMQYFTMIAIPNKSLDYFDIQKRPEKFMGSDGSVTERDLLRVTTPIEGSMNYQLYIGPKKQSDLEAVKSVDITGVIDYGMFKILVLPLLTALRWIHRYVHNYGLAIIILTFLLSILLFPLRLKQMLSMKKMQVVQPKVKAIQEKYKKYKKTDPKRAEMNQEVMKLYKEHNVNPLGGCLPLLLQFPLLFAFYSLLANSIELRHAPFIAWIQDLSVKDPYYILPIIMGITMFISQKMTPMTPGADPTQTKMMMFMPVVFTIMFFNVMSGLNLYFLCSNIFGVAFQKIFERWIGDRSPKQPAKSKRT